MSKFFQVRTDSEIDDSIYSYSTTWSSNRIVQELEQLRFDLSVSGMSVLRIDYLENSPSRTSSQVDFIAPEHIVNSNQLLVILDGVLCIRNQHYTDIDPTHIKFSSSIPPSMSVSIISLVKDSGSSGSNGYQYSQISRGGVTGTASSPVIINIPYKTKDFKVPRLQMLKFKDTSINSITTVLDEFSSTTASNFTLSELINFDGSMSFKTVFQYEMTYDALPYDEYTKGINKGDYKKIEGIEYLEVSTKPTIKITGVPNDQLIIQNKDYNLDSYTYIEGFELQGVGSKTKIVYSVDEGRTWLYFNGNNFVELNEFTKSAISTYGSTISDFNQIKGYWNDITTGAKKIRFAYLLSEDSVSDGLSLDRLIVKTSSGLGEWLQCKDTEYDVSYTENGIKVYCYIEGDIKINY